MRIKLLFAKTLYDELAALPIKQSCQSVRSAMSSLKNLIDITETANKAVGAQVDYVGAKASVVEKIYNDLLSVKAACDKSCPSLDLPPCLQKFLDSEDYQIKTHSSLDSTDFNEGLEPNTGHLKLRQRSSDDFDAIMAELDDLDDPKPIGSSSTQMLLIMTTEAERENFAASTAPLPGDASVADGVINPISPEPINESVKKPTSPEPDKSTSEQNSAAEEEVSNSFRIKF